MVRSTGNVCSTVGTKMVVEIDLDRKIRLSLSQSMLQFLPLVIS